jgi:hypothetical protein
MRLPMNALLSQALVSLTLEYEQRGAGSASLPTLAVWSNVLGPVGDGIELRDLPAAARLSKRTVRAAVGAAERQGWLDQEGTTVRPSPAGEAAGTRWPALDAEIDASVGGDLVMPLRAVVRQLHLEWPHYPTGYGPADHSITGGIYAADGAHTDSKVPTHGADWAPVLRHDVDGSSVADLHANIHAIIEPADVPAKYSTLFISRPERCSSSTAPTIAYPSVPAPENTNPRIPDRVNCASTENVSGCDPKRL